VCPSKLYRLYYERVCVSRMFKRSTPRSFSLSNMLVFETRNQTSFREEVVPKGGDKKYERMRELLGGSYQLLPHRKGYEAPFTAYVNEEGMNIDLPSNFLSWGVLRGLGFLDDWNLGFHFGNVILLGRQGKALTEKNKEEVRRVFQLYMKEMGDNDSREEHEKREITEDKKTKASGELEKPNVKRARKNEGKQ
jgi:hypothetical protein